VRNAGERLDHPNCSGSAIADLLSSYAFHHD